MLKWVADTGRFLFVDRFQPAGKTFHSELFVFMVVTIETQQLPIAAVGRIVLVVVILVMNRKFTKSFS